MRYTRRAKATITIVCNGKAVSQPVTLFQEADGRWFYTVTKPGGGVTVQYVLGSPQSGFWLGPAEGDTLPQR